MKGEGPVKGQGPKKDKEPKKGQGPKKGPRRTFLGAPMSLESRTGSNTFITVDYSKKRCQLSEAEKRNLIEIDDICNIPNGFGWTDMPFPPKEPCMCNIEGLLKYQLQIYLDQTIIFLWKHHRKDG